MIEAANAASCGSNSSEERAGGTVLRELLLDLPRRWVTEARADRILENGLKGQWDSYDMLYWRGICWWTVSLVVSELMCFDKADVGSGCCTRRRRLTAVNRRLNRSLGRGWQICECYLSVCLSGNIKGIIVKGCYYGIFVPQRNNPGKHKRWWDHYRDGASLISPYLQLCESL